MGQVAQETNNAESGEPTEQSAGGGPAQRAEPAESGGTRTAVGTGVAPRQAPRDNPPAQPRHWNVVLIDDDEHTYDYVIRMMQTLFACDAAKALRIAQTVDSEGRAVCMTTHKELAELKREQVLSFGRDPLMAVSKGAMTAIIEPAQC